MRDIGGVGSRRIQRVDPPPNQPNRPAQIDQPNAATHQGSASRIGELRAQGAQRAHALFRQLERLEQGANGTRAATNAQSVNAYASPDALERNTSEMIAAWQNRALESAGIDPAQWDPSKGFEHNRETVEKVYQYYTDLYNQDSNLRWAGMAKMAGGTVFGGLQKIELAQQAERLLPDLPDLPDLPNLPNLPWGLPDLPDLPDLPNLPNVEAAAESALRLEETETTLLQMQKDIFMDLAWQHQAYVEGGLPALEAMHQRGADVDIEAWRDIASGDENRVWSGNTVLLRREQEEVLAAGYDTLDNIPTTRLGLSVLAESPVPGGRPFQIVNPGGDLTNFNDRWEWIETDMLPAYRELSPEHRDRLINQPLEELADRDFAPADPNQRRRPWWLPPPILPPILPWLR